MEAQAIEIGCEDWPDLRERYLPETSQTILGLSTISNYIRWSKKLGRIKNLAIYSLDGDWSDVTFVVMDRYHLYCDTSSSSIARLKILLELLDYSKGVRVAHVRSKCYPAVSEVFRQKQFDLIFDDPNLLFYLPKELATTVDFELPKGFSSRSLSKLDAVDLNKAWPFSHCGSLYYLQQLACLNISCGIFTDNGNDLVSYGLHCSTGPIGLLQTKPAYRNRRLGTLVTKILTKEIGESGFGATACVSQKNGASRAIFEKIGFKIVDEVHWLHTKTFDWADETYSLES